MDWRVFNCMLLECSDTYGSNKCLGLRLCCVLTTLNCLQEFGMWNDNRSGMWRSGLCLPVHLKQVIDKVIKWYMVLSLLQQLLYICTYVQEDADYSRSVTGVTWFAARFQSMPYNCWEVHATVDCLLSEITKAKKQANCTDRVRLLIGEFTAKLCG
jgi:hypothetical protein